MHAIVQRANYSKTKCAEPMCRFGKICDIIDIDIRRYWSSHLTPDKEIMKIICSDYRVCTVDDWILKFDFR